MNTSTSRDPLDTLLTVLLGTAVCLVRLLLLAQAVAIMGMPVLFVAWAVKLLACGTLSRPCSAVEFPLLPTFIAVGLFVIGKMTDPFQNCLLVLYNAKVKSVNYLGRKFYQAALLFTSYSVAVAFAAVALSGLMYLQNATHKLSLLGLHFATYQGTRTFVFAFFFFLMAFLIAKITETLRGLVARPGTLGGLLLIGLSETVAAVAFLVSVSTFWRDIEESLSSGIRLNSFMIPGIPLPADLGHGVVYSHSPVEAWWALAILAAAFCVTRFVERRYPRSA